MKGRKKRLGEVGLSLEEEEALLCKLCLCVYDQTYKLPHKLTCGHAFCHPCVLKHLRKEAGKGGFGSKTKGKCEKGCKVKWEDEGKGSKIGGVNKVKCPLCKVKTVGGGEIDESVMGLMLQLQAGLKSGEALVHKDLFEASKGLGLEEGEMEFHGVKPATRVVVKSRNLRLHPAVRGCGEGETGGGGGGFNGYSVVGNAEPVVVDESVRCQTAYVASTTPPSSRLEHLWEGGEGRGSVNHSVTAGIEMGLSGVEVSEAANFKPQNRRTAKTPIYRPPTLRGIYTPNPAYSAAADDGGLDWNYFTASSTIGPNSTLPKYREFATPPSSPPPLFSSSRSPSYRSSLCPTISSSVSQSSRRSELSSVSKGFVDHYNNSNNQYNDSTNNNTSYVNHLNNNHNLYNSNNNTPHVNPFNNGDYNTSNFNHSSNNHNDTTTQQPEQPPNQQQPSTTPQQLNPSTYTGVIASYTNLPTFTA